MFIVCSPRCNLIWHKLEVFWFLHEPVVAGLNSLHRVTPKCKAQKVRLLINQSYCYNYLFKSSVIQTANICVLTFCSLSLRRWCLRSNRDIFTNIWNKISYPTFYYCRRNKTISPNAKGLRWIYIQQELKKIWFCDVMETFFLHSFRILQQKPHLWSTGSHSLRTASLWDADRNPETLSDRRGNQFNSYFCNTTIPRNSF